MVVLGAILEPLRSLWRRFGPHGVTSGAHWAHSGSPLGDYGGDWVILEALWGGPTLSLIWYLPIQTHVRYIAHMHAFSWF